MNFKKYLTTEGVGAKIYHNDIKEFDMGFLVNLYNLFSLQMREPTNYGWFHMLFICAVIAGTVVICKLFKDCPDKTVRLISAIAWGVVLSLEIYKQLIYGFNVEGERLVWDYAWYAFPFQFCSSPLYILPIIAFAKNEKIRGACIFYMMTFSLFAGLAVFCYPNDVFVETIGINIQTMIHHGSQILMGVFYIVRYREELNIKRFFSGFAVFATMVFVAMSLNISVYHIFSAVNIDETFNMFYISPYFDCTLPLLSLIWGRIPYIAFVMVYFFGFILCALIVYGVAKGAIIGGNRLYQTFRNKKQLRR